MQQNLGFYLSDVSRLIRRRFDSYARADGLTGAQWRVLLTVAKHPGINQGQLAEALEVEPITICRMIDRMESAGLVERRADPGDRRARLIFPADDAERLIAAAASHGTRVIESATAGLAPEDRERLLGLMEHIRRNLLDDALFTAREPA